MLQRLDGEYLHQICVYFLPSMYELVYRGQQGLDEETYSGTVSSIKHCLYDGLT